MTTRTTFALIHGGGSTARFWDRLAPLLEAAGGRVLALDLPGRGDKPAELATLTVDDEVASVVADLRADLRADLQAEAAARRAEGPLVVVAHSSGGLVVPGVLRALERPVDHVVLNAALVPAEGGCGLDCMQPRHRDGLVLALEMAEADGTLITTPGPPADPESFRRAYGGAPLDDDDLAFVVDPVRCVQDTVNHYFQPVRWSDVPDVAVTYIVNDDDRPVPTATQEEMIGHLPRPPRVEHLGGGHIPAVTQPEALAALLLAVVAR
jgi:pimeloyl-ACP methyl ester carboxylesterase